MILDTNEAIEATALAMLTLEPDRLRLCAGPAPCYKTRPCSCTISLHELARAALRAARDAAPAVDEAILADARMTDEWRKANLAIIKKCVELETALAALDRARVSTEAGYERMRSLDRQTKDRLMEAEARAAASDRARVEAERQRDEWMRLYEETARLQSETT